VIRWADDAAGSAFVEDGQLKKMLRERAREPFEKAAKGVKARKVK